MTTLLVIVIIIASAWFLLRFADGQKTGTGKVTLKAYKSRDDAINDQHDLCGEGEFDQEIVGEASYQKAIAVIVSALPDGHNIVQATIEFEDHNPHDNKAVAVKIGGLTVGYLPRETARAYRKLAAQKNIPRKATCPAMIFGGEDRYYGIWLGIPEI